MLFFDKLLPVFAYPLGAAVALGLLSLALSWTRFRNLGRALLAVVLVVLWIASTPFFANWLGWRLESQFPVRAVDELPERDAILLLGGSLAPPTAPGARPTLGEAGDRILEAVRLYRAGKAQRIIVTGGNLPWSSADPTEADAVAGILEEFGVPRGDLVIEGASRNTRENAVNSADILQQNGLGTALLVTSAFHMPRAMAVFRKAGVDVTAAPADLRARRPFYRSLLDVLPDANALAHTTLAVKELIGLVVYRARGWA